MEEPDDDFLKFSLLNMCAPKIMALLVPIHFMFIRELLTEGFVLKKNFSSYSFLEAALKWDLFGFEKAIFEYFFINFG